MTRPATGGRLLGGRYALGPTIGIGGMAEVFRGTDTRLGREVAVKVLRVDLARDPSVQQRFQREAQSAASLNAPCIVAVYDSGEDTVDGTAGVPWIVMEYVEGRTLREVLREQGPLRPETALPVLADVCAALEVAHRAGIVHRDIKPANVMLTDAGEVKVMDFGIARAAAGGNQTMTQTAHVIGTAAYLSPEQARGELVDARSDVYSAGCLLYELLTGRPPFSGDSPVAVAYQHVREEPLPPSAVVPGLPPEVDAVVLTALAKAPAGRYQSAELMRADLLRAAAGQPVQAPPPVRVPAPRPGVLRGAGYVLFALLLVAVLAGTAYAVRALATPDRRLVAVPQVVGMLEADARATLLDSGFVVTRAEGRFSAEPAGEVLEQSPTADMTLDVERRNGIALVVSTGLEMTVVPRVVGVSEAEAKARLEQARLALAPSVARGGNVAPGQVLEVIPGEGAAVAVGAPVTLVVASGQVEVPLVVGTPQAEAVDALRAAGFNVKVRLQDDRGAAGVVLSQQPLNATALRGSEVVLVVSRRPAPPPSPTPRPTPTLSATPTPTGSPSPEPTGTPSASPSSSPPA